MRLAAPDVPSKRNYFFTSKTRFRRYFALSRFDFQVRHLERLTRPVLLQPICKGKRVVHLVVLIDVQPAIQQNLPAVVGDDVARVDAVGGVKCPVN
jgi:hypothetical protein